MAQGQNIQGVWHTRPGAHRGTWIRNRAIARNEPLYASGGRKRPGGRAAATPFPWLHPSPATPKGPPWRQLLRPKGHAHAFVADADSPGWRSRSRDRAHAFVGKPTAGGCGGVPRSGHGPGSGRRVRGRKIVIPLAGGESEGDHTVRPWGGRPVPFYSKAYPARRRACRRWSDQPVKELQHIWVHSEQTFRRILCRYRIFLAGRSWRGWPPGRTGPGGPCAVGEAARRADAPNG